MNKTKNNKNQLQKDFNAMEEMSDLSGSESDVDDEINDKDEEEGEGEEEGDEGEENEDEIESESENENETETEIETETKNVYQSTMIAPSTSTAKTIKNEGKATRPSKVPKQTPIAIMVIEAIENLNMKSGSSMVAIKKYIMSKDPNINEKRLRMNLRRFLKTAVASGRLKKATGIGLIGSFKLNKNFLESQKKKQTKAIKPKKSEPTEEVAQKTKSKSGTKAPKEKLPVKVKGPKETIKKAAAKSSEASKADMNNNVAKPTKPLKLPKAQKAPTTSVKSKANNKQKQQSKTAPMDIVHPTKHTENTAMTSTRRKLYNNGVALVVNPLLKLNTSLSRKSTQSKKGTVKSQGKPTTAKLKPKK